MVMDAALETSHFLCKKVVSELLRLDRQWERYEQLELLNWILKYLDVDS